MNIFATSSDPVKAAQYLDDRRLVKMVLETGQLLSGALYKLGYWKACLYKPTHLNHPCTIWARKSRGNFLWLVRHGQALAGEYEYRFLREHKSLFVIREAAKIFNDECRLDVLGMTPFANCTGIRGPGTTVSKYRKYMTTVKWVDSNPVWTRRGRPDWYKPKKM